MSRTASNRGLTVDDLAVLGEALAEAGDPPRIYRALEVLSGETIGHRLFTIMRVDPARSEVERVHTSMPGAYPVGGRKKKADTAWSDRVIRDMTVFRGAGADDIRAAFDDHRTILGLGLESVLNIPVVFAGHCIGTMNLLHEAGWYQMADERVGRLLGNFLVPVLVSHPA